MESLVLTASRAKAEVRLGYALSVFEESLSNERKALFQSYRAQAVSSTPTLEDVRRVVAEFDHQSGGKPVGGRFVKILKVVQQFTVFGDVIVGGAGNIVPSAIWGCVRLTLTVITNVASLREQVSELFMEIGQTAPRHQEIGVLYPKSKRLQDDLKEYFIVIVLLFQRLFRPSVLERVTAHFRLALVDPELKNLKVQLDTWAVSIDREISLLIGTRVEEEARENSHFRSLWTGFTEAEKKRRRLKARISWLDACSRYDYEKDRTRIRKQGRSTFFLSEPQYVAWRERAFTVDSASSSSKPSSTLLCRGILGSGKSVLLANFVDDLILARGERDYIVTYFFAITENSESQKATTILGSLARQILEAISDHGWMDSLGLASGMFKDALSPAAIIDLLGKVFSGRRKVFVVLDGLDQCPRNERLDLLSHLKALCRTFELLICSSLRDEVNLQPEQDLVLALNPDFVLVIPIANPDIETFVDTEIQHLLQLGELVVGSPVVLDEIKQCLLGGAAGMFLWVVLQLQMLCLARSDKAIRQALQDIPHGLPDTYRQILAKSRGFGPQYQLSILKILAAAFELLTTDQLGEALSVVPGETSWSDESLINDINITLASCGSLVVVDEEELTVRFVHPSVRQFLLGEMGDPKQSDLGSQEIHFSLVDVHRHMTGISVTYLGIFEAAGQIMLHKDATSSSALTYLAPAPSQVINAVTQSGVVSKRLVNMMTRISRVTGARETQRAADIQNIVQNAFGDRAPVTQHQGVFLPYAKSHWLVHSSSVHDGDGPVYDLWCQLIKGHDWHKIFLDVVGERRPLVWAMLHSHHALLDLQLRKYRTNGRVKILLRCLDEIFLFKVHRPSPMVTKDMDAKMATRCLALSMLLGSRGAYITNKLLLMGPDLSYGNYSALYLAVITANYAVVRRLLRCIAQTSTHGDPHKHTLNILTSLPYPLIERAVLNSDPRTLRLLVQHGANINIHSHGRRHPIIEALTLMVTAEPPDPRHICTLHILLKASGTSDANIPRDLINTHSYAWFHAPQALRIFKQHTRRKDIYSGGERAADFYIRPSKLSLGFYNTYVAISPKLPDIAFFTLLVATYLSMTSSQTRLRMLGNFFVLDVLVPWWLCHPLASYDGSALSSALAVAKRRELENEFFHKVVQVWLCFAPIAVLMFSVGVPGASSGNDDATGFGWAVAAGAMLLLGCGFSFWFARRRGFTFAYYTRLY